MSILITVSSSKGTVNSSIAELTYYPPSLTEPRSRPIDDLRAGLEIKFPRSDSQEEDVVEQIHIPLAEIVVLLPQEKGKFLLLHSVHLLEDISKYGGPKATSLLFPKEPEKRGIFEISNPPDGLIDRFLLKKRKLPEWLDVESGRVEVSVVVSSGAGANGKSEKLYGEGVKVILNTVGLSESQFGFEERGSEAKKEEQRKKAEYQLLRTESPDSIQKFIEHKFSTNQPQGPIQQTIILLSGDTSIQELINSLPSSHYHPPPLLILVPTGTGNALSNSIHINTSPLSSVLLGTPSPLPLFHTTFSPSSSLLISGNKHPIPSQGLYGAVVLSWAFHASLVADSDTPYYRKNYPGSTRFSVAAQRNLTPEPHVYKARISILQSPASVTSSTTSSSEPAPAWTPLPPTPEETKSNGYWYLVSTLVSRLEKTFVINPLSEPLDGKLRIIHFGGLATPQRAMEVMQEVYNGGKHVGMEEVGYLEEGVEGMRIELEEGDYVCGEEEEGDGDDGGRESGSSGPGRWRRICIDGAIVEVEKGGWVEVRMVRAEEGKERVRVLRRVD